MKKMILIFGTLLSCSLVHSQSCDPDNDIYTVTDENAFCTEVVDNVRHFYSNNYPDHADSYNSGFTVSASEINHSVCAFPVENGSFTPLYEETETDKGCNYTYKFGIAMNGIGFTPNSNEYFENTDDGSNNIEWHKEARYMFNGAFGNNGGHLNQFGSYHYHDIPVDYYTDDLGISIAAHSSIVGYAADGFPIYYKYVYSDAQDADSEITGLSSGYTLKEGDRPGDGISAPDGEYSGLYYEDYEYSSTTLDECNGRYGVTPDYPYGTYYYVLTDNYPYMPRCFKGTILDNTFRSLANCPESTADEDCAAEVTGCMDPFSTNYNANANSDDGSCTYAITWEGETSTDWYLASNWDGDVVPTDTDDVIIPAVDNAPEINADVEINDLTIDANGQLFVRTTSLTISGDLTLSGNLLVESGASLLPMGEVSGFGSASIYRNTTFEIDEGNYSVIGSPITEQYTPDLGDIVYSYDETIAYGDDGDGRFVEVDNPTLMDPADAYFSAFTGNLLFSGTPNSGDIPVDLVYNETNDGGATNAGYNLVSNPYAAAISYDDFVSVNDDIDGTLYIWDDGGSESGQRTNTDYLTITGMGAVSGGSGRSGDWDGYIRSAQGFFVKATSAGSLLFQPDMMSTTNNTDKGYFRKVESTLRLSLSSAQSSQELLIGFNESATTSFDENLDAYKSKGNNPIQFYSRQGERIMAIQALPTSAEQQIIDLGFDVADESDLTLSISGVDRDGVPIILIDHLLNKEVLLSKVETYEFSSDGVIDSHRFSLVINPDQILSAEVDVQMLSYEVYTRNNQIMVLSNQVIEGSHIIIYDLGGHVIKEFEQQTISEEPIALDFNVTGMFIMAIQSSHGISIQKIMN